MRFTEHLSAHITPEWRKQYVKYEELKDMLYQAKEDEPPPEIVTGPEIERYYAKFEENFLKYCDKELAKVNTFFSEKVAEAIRNFAQLQDEIRSVDSETAEKVASKLARRKTTVFTRPIDLPTKNKTHRQKLADVKLAFSEFYLSLILLQNYQSLNFTGFRKILKKYDKMMESERGAHFRQSRVEMAPFYTNKHIDNLILEVETLYINELEAGNRQRAMNKLRVPPLGAKNTNWTTYRVGLYSGIFIVLFGIIISAGILSPNDIDWRPALRMYRGMFLIILMIFLLGLNTYGWRKSGVNHVLIFELDPRHNLSHEHFLEIALFLAVLWALSILSFIYCQTLLGIPSYVNPLVLAGTMFIFFINPTRTLYWRARFWLLKILFHILIAPFHPVGFADFWLADQLNSLQTVLLDMEFFFCYYSCEVSWLDHDCAIQCHTFSYYARVFVACLPAWFRFAQCLRRYHDTKLIFPHLVNAGKYSTTFFVVCFSALAASNETGIWYHDPLFWMWVISAFLSSCYTLTWDLKMDWGLLSKNTQNNRLLREEIVYPDKSYYFAIVEDFCLRFVWTLTVSVGQLGYIEGDILVSILAPLEVFRRFVWNFFRLENEHLNNCGQFRAVRDISIKPDKEVSNPKKVEEMMDDESTIPLLKSKPEPDTDLLDMIHGMAPSMFLLAAIGAGQQAVLLQPPAAEPSSDLASAATTTPRLRRNGGSSGSKEKSMEKDGDKKLQMKDTKVKMSGKKTKTEVETVGGNKGMKEADV